jgi:hypothetical protein
VCAGACVLGWALLAGSARADGDPASDVLASQSLYLPQDAGVSPTHQTQLRALVARAQRSGDQIRVAMIGSPTDLGSVTELWRQPQNYAKFLAQELSLVYPRTVLVVMPNGYGLGGVAGSPGAERVALAGLSRPGADLGAATLTAIEHLAAASGHTLAVPTAAAPRTSGSADTLAWIVFVIGSALIVLAWTGSLRARPLSLRRSGA